MNMPSRKYLNTIIKEEKVATSAYNQQQQQWITIACLTVFPLIYLLGKLMMTFLG